MGSAPRPDVVVVGAGVVGLTTALRLAESGRRVEIRAGLQPERTTSAQAGAIWGPYVVEDDRVPGWSHLGLDWLRVLAESGRSTGVTIRAGVEAAASSVPPPYWTRWMPDLELLPERELPPGYVSGWRYSVPVAEMEIFLRYLRRRTEQCGVRLLAVPAAASIDEFLDLAPVVVNCTGLGSAALVSDGTLYPVQGQLVVVENPGIDCFFTDYQEVKEPTYFIPHDRHVVLGGTAVPHFYETDPDPEVGREIIARCAVVEPKLANAKVIGHRVGLRPARPTIRLEAETRNGTTVIHNYGHGGAGVTLAWGCAGAVLELLGISSGTRSLKVPQ